MAACREYEALSRRAFMKRGLGGLALLAGADPLLQLVGQSYAQSAGGTGNLLVLCQLNGGMDALSFLAPYQNSVYQSRRPKLGLQADDVHPLHDHPEVGINKQFGFFADLYQQGQLAVVQQTAYPRGNGSHFESQEIYEFGVRNLSGVTGANVRWYERLRNMYFDEPYGVLDTRRTGDPRKYGYPDSTYRKAAQEAFGRLARLRAGDTATQQAVLDSYDNIDVLGQEIRTRTEAFDSTGDSRDQFWRAAALASAGLGTRVIKLQYGGFDTHANQASANERLFPKINDHFEQFVNDAKAIGIWERTCVVFYTEFGRRNEENGSPGTDHGHGCHMILAGPNVNGGLHGQMPSSDDLNQKNLPYYVDFRAVFSSAVRDWLGFDPMPIFNVEGETFDSNVGSALFR